MASERSGESPERIHSIVIRSWPKVIFLYPTFIATLVGGIWQAAYGADMANPEVVDTMETVGLIFILVLAFNLLVISFEFTRIKTVAILFLVIAVVSFLLFMSTKVEVLEYLKNLLWGLKLKMSTSFYFTFASYLLFVYLLVFVNTRWNYWVIRHNEIIHKTGFLGDIKRFPSPNLRMTKSINDVFEFLLLGSGRIALFPASEKEAIILENVLNVNRAERAIKRLLSAIAVEISSHGSVHEEDH